MNIYIPLFFVDVVTYPYLNPSGGIPMYVIKKLQRYPSAQFWYVISKNNTDSAAIIFFKVSLVIYVLYIFNHEEYLSTWPTKSFEVLWHR